MSIIVGLAVSDLLISFHRLLAGGSHVHWHWLPPVVALYMLLVTANFWWGWWGSYDLYEHASSVTLAQFLPTLAQAVLLFLMCAAALPDEIPADGLDLTRWYFGRARHLWGLNALVLLLVAGSFITRDVLGSGTILSAFRGEWANLAMLAGAIFLAFSKRMWLHASYVAVCLVGILQVSFSLTVGHN